MSEQETPSAPATPSVQPYDHEAANVSLRYEVVAMHRVIDSQRHRLSQSEALVETLREDLADAEKSVAEVAALRAQLDRAIHDGHLRRCDIPACNCGGYHSDLTTRLREEIEKRDEAREEVAALRAEVERLRTAIGDIAITNKLGYEGRISVTATHASIASLVAAALEVQP